jgi:hypothetical protein
MMDILFPLLGVVIGAAVSLVGIYFQNKENKKSREFELKKNAFADAVASIVQTNQTIMQIPSLTIDELGKRFSEANLGTSLTKLNLTASVRKQSPLGNIFPSPNFFG